MQQRAAQRVRKRLSVDGTMIGPDQISSRLHRATTPSLPAPRPPLRARARLCLSGNVFPNARRQGLRKGLIVDWSAESLFRPIATPRCTAAQGGPLCFPSSSFVRIRFLCGLLPVIPSPPPLSLSLALSGLVPQSVPFWKRHFALPIPPHHHHHHHQHQSSGRGSVRDFLCAGVNTFYGARKKNS